MSPLSSTRSVILRQVLGRLAPDLAGRRARNRSASSGRGSSASCRRRCSRAGSPCAGRCVVKPTMSPSGPTPPATFAAELDEDAGRIGVRIGDFHRLVGLEVADIRKAVRWITEPSKLRARLHLIWDDACRGCAGCGDPRPGQEFSAANINHSWASLHQLSPPYSAVPFRSRIVSVQTATRPLRPVITLSFRVVMSVAICRDLSTYRGIVELLPGAN